MQSLLFQDVATTNTGQRTMRRSSYASTLAAVLGNGAEWEYRGECFELPFPTGKCACGQVGLRFEFRIHHADGRSVIVGSSCIETYPEINPDMAARIRADVDRLLSQKAERERAAREAGRSRQIQQLMAEWSEAEYATDLAAHAWRQSHPWVSFVPQAIYARGCVDARLNDRKEGKPHRFCKLPALKTSAGQLRRLREYLATCAAELAAVRACD